MPNWKSALATIRDGHWITEERLRVYPRIFLSVWIAGLFWLLFSPVGRPWAGSDFTGFWVPAHLAATGHQTAIYDPWLLSKFEQMASGRKGIYLPFIYPPSFLLFIHPLGLMPFWAAFFALEITSLLAFGALIYRIFGARGLAPAFAFPGLAICIYNGHFEVLLAVCFGLAILLLDSMPYVAGVLIGICSVKPHLFLIVPVALIAGRYWRTILSATLTTVASGMAATAAFGTNIWYRFVGSLHHVGEGLAIGQNSSFDTVLAKQQSIFAFGARLFGLDVAFLLQVVTAGVAGWVVSVVWMGNGALERRALSLCACTLLATPYLFDYDLVLLAIPIALSTRSGLQNGFLPWRKSLLASLWLVPALARISSLYCDFPLTVALLGCSAALVLWEHKFREGVIKADQCWRTGCGNSGI